LLCGSQLTRRPPTSEQTPGAGGAHPGVLRSLFVDHPDGVFYARLADPFAALLAEHLAAVLKQDMKNPDHALRGRGSKKARLVELTGLEQARPSPR
jgi:hypothetical protein